MFNYRLTLEPDDNGTVLVTSPDFPIVTYGDDAESAMRHAVEATEAILSSMMEAREEIPAAQTPEGYTGLVIHLPLQTVLKVTLYMAMRSAGLTRADLQRRLGWQRESVDRLFRLGHNSKIEQLDEAFRALHREIDVQVRPIVEGVA
jgi:antitoxin HicB